MNTKQHFRWAFAILLVTASLLACSKSQHKQTSQQPLSTNLSSRDCVKSVIALDDSLGKVRNHACETLSLAQTIQNYANGLQRIDFRNCPPGFTAAFAKHRQAWLDMIPLAETHPELRGEMHVLFDKLEKGADAETFKPLLKAIWDTWAEIETAMKE